MATIDKITETEVAVARLKEMISAEGLAEGDKLPAESELAQKMNVGASRVREAILVLQTLGYLAVQRGKGVFVAKSQDTTPEDPTHWFAEHAFQMGDFMETRSIIETAAVKVAVRRADASEIKELERIHKAFEEAMERDEIVALVEADKSFHHAIIKATHNRVLAIVNHRLERAFEKYRVKAFAIRESRLHSLQPHRNILDAITARDADRAEREMRNHLDVAYRNMPE